MGEFVVPHRRHFHPKVASKLSRNFLLLGMLRMSSSPIVLVLELLVL